MTTEELHQEHAQLLQSNRNWAKGMTDEEPDYFINLDKGQMPPYLWVGCADSRVPANVLTGTRSGEVFVHRNIANMVVHTDMNFMSVLQYAVEVLKVRHIIVCGHYGCGGVNAALGHANLGMINKWLRNIKEVYDKNTAELEGITDQKELSDRLTELNVKEQVKNLAKTSVVQQAWKDRGLLLHGWVYDIKEGIVKDLDLGIDGPGDLPDIFRVAL